LINNFNFIFVFILANIRPRRRDKKKFRHSVTLGDQKVVFIISQKFKKLKN